jgi:hypothetical protein
MADYPDVYADGFSLSAGPFGVTVTFTPSLPSDESGPHEEPTEPILRSRLSVALAKAISDAFQQVSAAAAQAGQTSTTIKH